MEEAGAVTVEQGYYLTGIGQASLFLYDDLQSEFTVDNLEYLLNSENRVKLLSTLSESPTARQNLVTNNALPSRETIRRTICGGVERDWITETTNRVISLTDTGAEAYATIECAIRRAEQFSQRREFVKGFGRAFPAYPFEVLERSSYNLAAKSASTAVLDPMSEFFGMRDALAGESPTRLGVLLPVFLTCLAHLLLAHANTGANITLICTDTVIKAAIKRGGRGYLEDLHGHDNISLWIFGDTISIGIIASPHRANFTTVNEIGKPVTVSTTHPTAIEWAHTTVDTKQSAATSVADTLAPL